jgi:L-amino acid N-acyltransferase YncA
MSANYIIREATDTDYPQILAIYRYCWDEHFKNTPVGYDKVLSYLKESFEKRQGYYNFWVCDNGEGEIYGWLSCLRVFDSPLRKDFNGEISIYISHNMRNGIIASKLSDEVINRILNRTPLLVLWAQMDPENTSVQKLASYYGFKKEISTIHSSMYFPITEVWIKTYEKE